MVRTRFEHFIERVRFRRGRLVNIARVFVHEAVSVEIELMRLALDVMIVPVFEAHLDQDFFAAVAGEGDLG